MIFTARKNLKLEVSDKQMQILVGCLLGDAYITKSGKIQIEQCDKQKEHVVWKHQELASISYSGLKEVVRYDKIFPKDLNNWITPLAIAVWYMDDGCYQKFDCTLSTESFDSETKEKLIKQLKVLE